MSVLTEAKIRKLFRNATIAENGVFELATNEKLTPAARGFLNDHHVKVVHSNQQKGRAPVSQYEISKEPINTIEDSVVYPLLFRLTKLYSYFLRSQRELHLAFQTEKCDQLGVILAILEKMVGHHILDDIADYDTAVLTNAELQAIRVTKQLDQQNVMMGYQEAAWRLVCYETYIETTIVRKEIERVADNDQDVFATKVSQLLKSIEVLLWLIASE
ncbi:hypothetical protein [Streptococcus merionis]|uniref:Ethanolamine utilization cobalamin adenosyltransferase n=1 Tax=Streptococcus merionis TaxID=400065 RepID=A0A239SN83_9STRE|nr:hypothetical protein [Streptococcus merionis]SNU86712.1 Ethanolamine utilization cobalamin adenosyltransferase [Streptococcus merionis]